MKDNYGDCWMYPISKIHSLLNGLVSKTTKINGKELNGDITLTATDVNAVPKTRTVNGKALSSNITLTAEDVGAVSLEDNTVTDISSKFTFNLTGGSQKITAFYNSGTKMVHGTFSVYNPTETITGSTAIYTCNDSNYMPVAGTAYCGLFSTESAPSVLIPSYGDINTSGEFKQSLSGSAKNCYATFEYKVAPNV